MQSTATVDRDPRHLERLVLLSDAVFAIAITLLVVDIRLPDRAGGTDEDLAQALLNLIPNYIGFLVSFLVIGRYWVSHHRLFGLLKYGSDRLLWANLLFLMAIVFLPFPTRVYSQHITLRTAVALYTGWLIVTGLLYQRLNRIVLSDPALLGEQASADDIQDRRRSAWISILIGAIAFAAGMIQPLWALAGLTLSAPLVIYLVKRRPAKRAEAAAG